MPVKRRRSEFVDDPAFFRMAKRIIEAAGARAAAGDPAEHICELQELQDVLDRAMLTAIAGMRRSGATWESIGLATGVTRQAALMRWSPKLAAGGEH